MRISVKSTENVFLGVTTFVMSGALLEILLPGRTELSGNATFRFILAVLYLGVCVIAFRESNRFDTLRALYRNPAVPCLLLLSCVSSLWSASPTLCLQRSIAVAGTTLVGVTLAAQRSIEELLELLSRTLRVVAVLCLGCMIVVPRVAWSSLGLQGVFNQKNNLGEAMAVAILVNQYLPGTTKRSHITKIIWLSIYGSLLFLSRSATALVSLCAAILAAQVYRTLRRRLRIPMGVVLFGIGCAAIVAGVIMADTNILPSVVGRSTDLTGRTELWSLVISAILKRPLLGYGYSGFWDGASPESTDIARRIGWAPAYSHNGYLELVLNLGIAGLLLFAVFVIRGIVRAVHAAEARDEGSKPTRMWPLAFLVFFAVHNMAECTILWQNNLEWAILLSTVIGADPNLVCETQAELRRDADDVSYVAT
jgi:exopolysaccharide production protein ExoQ